MSRRFVTLGFPPQPTKPPGQGAITHLNQNLQENIEFSGFDGQMCSPRDTNTHRAKNTAFKNLEHNVTLLFESFPPPING